ncbi:hypothetical protein [Bradyrhizobium sp. URHD0069]|uniref:hypothetical protein n=1 Tax=Bradyrhizobium sp. URHD0069 TaxID=1380355 RepID=UPI000496C02E|nr:hypothetical protein [Bradyrhizobium sp. URHD0069]
MVSKTEALRRLTYREASAEHHKAFEQQVRAELNDRGACILISANLENALDAALQQVLSPPHDDMFEADGPLATFARKISMAHAFRIIGPVTKENFRLIRHVRNAFAHAKVPIEFKTPEVKALIDDLLPYNMSVSPPVVLPSDKAFRFPRNIFEDVCNSISYLLYTYSLGPILQFDHHGLKDELGHFPQYDLYLQKKPLP